MFVNKLFTISRAHTSKSKNCFNVKSSTYCFHMKTKILADFQIYMKRGTHLGFNEIKMLNAFRAVF